MSSTAGTPRAVADPHPSVHPDPEARPAGAAGALVRGHLRLAPTAPVLSGIGCSVIAAVVLTIGLVQGSDVLAAPEVNAAVRGLLGASYGAVGLLTWARRPTSRLGPLLLALIPIFGLTALQGSSESALFTLGRVAWVFLVLGLFLVMLSFPSGRLTDTAARRVFAVAASGSLLLWAIVLLGTTELPPGGILTRCDGPCPANPFASAGVDPAVADALAGATTLYMGLMWLAIAALIATRLRTGTAAYRRVLELPVLALILAAVSQAVGSVLLMTVGDTPVALGASWLAIVGMAAFPFALLIGQERGRLFAGAAIKDMIGRLARSQDPTNVEDVLRRALRDPSLELVYWVPALGSFVDAYGWRVDPAVDPSRIVTAVHVDGHRVAAILHDPAFAEVPGLVESAGDAVLLALENNRLEAELQATVEELRAVQGAATSARATERRRLERDLHDGAQQRLIALRIRLSLAEEAAAPVSESLRERLAGLGSDTEAALESVRVTAHGIYPQLLSRLGVVGALRTELARAAVPVSVEAPPLARSTDEAEIAVYYCCLEAVQNAVKHAGPGARVAVRLRPNGTTVDFEVEDDGVGLDPACGTGMGLTTMRERLEEVGGRVEVGAGPGGGVSVVGSVPWPAP